MRRLVAVLMIALAACGGGGDDDAPDAASDPTTTTSTAAPATSEATAGETATSTTAAATSTTAPATAAGGAPSAETATGPAPVAPGTYRYRQTGSTTGGGQTYEAPPEGTLVVDPAGGDGRQTSHRYVDPDGEAMDTAMRFGDDGMFIVETVIRQRGFEIRCTFDPPLAAPPWPPAVGSTYSGTGECGAFTAEVNGRITGTRTVELDGRRYDAVVLESTLTTKGQFESEGTQLDWFVPELRLSAHTETESSGKFGEVSFESTGTSDLISATPR